MNFADAFLAMTQGEKVRLPWWKGYWYIQNNTIRIHCSDGRDFDIRESEEPLRTVSYMTADCWQYVPDTTVMQDLQQEMRELCKV